MNDISLMWNFPVKESVTFENANRVHPLMQERVQRILESVRQDKNIRRLVIFGSSLDFRCSSASDIDLYIEKYDVDKKLAEFPELECNVDIVMNLSKDSELYREIDRTGLVLFERS